MMTGNKNVRAYRFTLRRVLETDASDIETPDQKERFYSILARLNPDITRADYEAALSVAAVYNRRIDSLGDCKCSGSTRNPRRFCKACWSAHNYISQIADFAGLGEE